MAERVAERRRRTVAIAVVVSVLGAAAMVLLISGCAGNRSGRTASNGGEEVTQQTRCDTLNIAHRGARSVAPENTIEAARKGLEMGADLWELDVQLSADDELVVIHDDTLERTSNVETAFADREPWNVSDFTLAEIRELDFGSWFNEEDPFGQIEGGVVSAEDRRSYEGIGAPTLREALEWTSRNDWKVNVELKHLGEDVEEENYVERVVGLIQELGMTKDVLISSFNHDYLVRAKAADSTIPTGALVGRGIDDPAGYVRDLGADAYNPSSEAISPSRIPDLREQDVEVYVYTVNEEDELARLVEAGATGIFTDFPQRLARVLDECRHER